MRCWTTRSPRRGRSRRNVDRAEVLAALAAQLSGKAKSAVLDEALAAARAIKGEIGGVLPLAALAAQLSKAKSALLDEALAAARAIKGVSKACGR